MGIKVDIFLVCLYMSVRPSVFLSSYLSVNQVTICWLVLLINTLKKNIWQVIHLHARTFIYFYFIFLEVLNIPLINSCFLNVIDNHNTELKNCPKTPFPALGSHYFLTSSFSMAFGHWLPLWRWTWFASICL